MSCFGIERRWKNYFHFISGSELSASVEEKKLECVPFLASFRPAICAQKWAKGKKGIWEDWEFVEMK